MPKHNRVIAQRKISLMLAKNSWEPEIKLTLPHMKTRAKRKMHHPPMWTQLYENVKIGYCISHNPMLF